MPIIQKTSNLKIEKPEAAHAAWEQAYWRLATIVDLWLTQLAKGHHVKSGGTLTLNGNNVDLAATVVAFAGQAAPWSVNAQTAITGLVSGRTYVVYVDNAGALQVSNLDASGLWSEALPSEFVLLGLVFEVEGAWTIHGRPLTMGRYQANGVPSLDQFIKVPVAQAYAESFNAIIGAGLELWPEGTPINSTTNPANNDDTYVAGPWYLLSDGNNIVDVSREIGEIGAVSPQEPTNGYYALRATQVTAAKKAGFAQIIPADETAKLLRRIDGVEVGKVSLSFTIARVDLGGGPALTDFRAVVLAWTGTPDAVTSDVVSAWNAGGSNPTWAASLTAENTPAAITIGNLAGLVRVTIENIVLDTSGIWNLVVFIWNNDTAVGAGDYWQLRGVQLNAGPVALPFQHRPFQQEEQLFSYFYNKTFARGTMPAQNAGAQNALGYSSAVGGAVRQGTSWNYPTRMRTTPTLTFYNPSAANALWRNITAVTDSGTPAAAWAGDRGVNVFNPQVAGDGAGHDFEIHITANARL